MRQVDYDDNITDDGGTNFFGELFSICKIRTSAGGLYAGCGAVNERLVIAQACIVGWRTISEVRVGDASEGASWSVKKLDQRLTDMKKVDDVNTLGNPNA